MLKIIFDNLSNIRDICWILFSAIATILAIKTYRNAKKTLMQPLRTEVAKKQTDLFIDLLTFFYSDSNAFDKKIHQIYQDLISVNATLLMSELGFVTKKPMPLEEIYSRVSGILILVREGKLDWVKLPETFSPIQSENRDTDSTIKSKELYQKVKDGTFNLEKIHLTLEFQKINNEMHDFSTNIFLPKQIVDELNKLESEIHYNISEVLKEVLEQFIFELTKKGQTNVDIIGLYNTFQRKTIRHDNTIQGISNQLREYLLIDKKWD